MTVTPEQINEAYRNIEASAKAWYDASVNVVQYRADLKLRIAQAWNDGILTGSNDTARKAAEATHFERDNAMLQTLEQKADQYKHQMEIDQYEVQRVRALLRIDEVLARLTPEE